MRDESHGQMRNWAPERMALKTHPKGSKGVYKDNLSWVAGVKVETKKRKKGYEGKFGSGGEGRGKEKENIFFLF